MKTTRIPNKPPAPRRQAWSGLLLAGLLLAMPAAAHAAIGCTLSNPARDLKALFPNMTSYREDVKEMHRLPGGAAAHDMLRARVGNDLDPVYEAADTPYTLYSVFHGDQRIGYVHGVNVPGRGGVIQIFLALDPDHATINRMVYQRLEGPGAMALRNPAVTGQFAGLSLADFYKHDYYAAAEPGAEADRVGRLSPPPGLAPEAIPDWTATIRGVRKNLILMDIFVFERRHDPFHQRAEQARRLKENQP
ncbi:MAG: hypothetical protein GX803_00825 [Lentisphaerae bacterium]|jgi:hypothetical protein|nr:hypothetical protein [Lentisphaerota bacterium]